MVEIGSKRYEKLNCHKFPKISNELNEIQPIELCNYDKNNQ